MAITMSKESRLVKKMTRRPEIKSPITEDIFLPNYSGQVNGAIRPRSTVWDDLRTPANNTKKVPCLFVVLLVRVQT